MQEMRRNMGSFQHLDLQANSVSPPTKMKLLCEILMKIPMFLFSGNTRDNKKLWLDKYTSSSLAVHKKRSKRLKFGSKLYNLVHS
ncbi:hypothetical protein L1987_03537 [Smallanthus sonchifolius]|uniref:Uncharacterized protein n=1 Tax=Smallanthus sonchifolius TaxID=185202 RepID=A0ACB9KAX5_9ASTR|nr:hypothetical protein L1987_03537 [Smallanthus sonchifolius]